MQKCDWLAIENLCTEIFALEQAVCTGGAPESALQALYAQLNDAMYPAVLEMARALMRNRREAERIARAFLERTPLILPIYAEGKTACEHWMGRAFIDFVYTTLPDAQKAPEATSRLMADGQLRGVPSSEAQQLLERVQRTLSPEEFLVWYDYVINGYALTDIAPFLQTSLSEAEEMLQRARRRLWESMATDTNRRTRADILGQRLTWIGAPNAYPHSSVALGVADNGMVVGVAFAEEYRYSDARGNYPVYITGAFRWHSYQLEVIGELGENCQPHCMISIDGSAVFISSDAGCLCWTHEQGVRREVKQRCVYAMSADGKVMVGEQDSRAVRWVGDSVVPLSDDSPSAAYGVSADGKHIVGQIRQQAVRWTETGAPQRLGTLEGGTSEARAISRDGTVIVGKSDGRAFRWTPDEGMCALRPVEGELSQAHSVSYDGTRIVGEALDDNGGLLAFLWTPEDGMQDLNQLFAHLRAAGERLERAYAISPNGRYIVGEGYCPETDRNEAFILDLGEFSC